VTDETDRTHRQQNNGLRKRCACSRRAWPKCTDPWHFNYVPDRGPAAGEAFRFSLERVVNRLVKDSAGKWRRDRATLGAAITNKTDALSERNRLRTAITDGSIFGTPKPESQRAAMTLEQLLSAYSDQYITVNRPDSARNVASQIRVIKKTPMVRVDGRELAFGDWLVVDITTDTIEAYRRVRLPAGIVATNRDLSLLRAMFNWAASKRRRLAEDNPFLDGAVAAVKLQRETARRRRLRPGEEERLFAACSSYLRVLVEAAIETGCRRGELLSLQWHQVRLEPKAELLLPAGKTKSKRDRTVPISSRLRAILAMRRCGPDGEEHPGEAYVFGNEVGEQVSSIKRGWQAAVLRAHGHKPVYVVKVVGEGKSARKVRTALLTRDSQAALRSIDLHFHDLRREAGSRWLERGVPLHRIQKWLGHANISQTSTYLMADGADDDEAMRRFEERSGRVQRGATDSPTGGQNLPASDTIANTETQLSSEKHH
jgi:integrase